MRIHAQYITPGDTTLLIILMLLILASVGCVTQRTSVDDIWVNGDSIPLEPGSMLVVVYSRNPALAAKLENEWVRQLNSLGYAAKPLNAVSPSAYTPSSDEVRSLARATASSTILSTEILAHKQVERDYPASQVATLEISLYGTEDEHLHWSSTAETFLESPDGLEIITPSDRQIEAIVSELIAPLFARGLLRSYPSA